MLEKFLTSNQTKTWITLNEPYMASTFGYDTGRYAPGKVAPGVGSYKVGHNMLRAHARAYTLYKANYYSTQKGKVS